MKALSGAVVILAASLCLGAGVIAVAISGLATKPSASDMGVSIGMTAIGFGVFGGLVGLFALSRGWRSE